MRSTALGAEYQVAVQKTPRINRQANIQWNIGQGCPGSDILSPLYGSPASGVAQEIFAPAALQVVALTGRTARPGF